MLPTLRAATAAHSTSAPRPRAANGRRYRLSVALRRRPRARTADAAEKARLWPTMAGHWPRYDDYQAKTDRDIPVVVLDRV
ncbi:MAG: DUF385 domain-containing protein [Streptosporangiales bacterium]|nr:DUF385 domain-containing protein [Streptosporangiales bacterium]